MKFNVTEIEFDFDDGDFDTLSHLKNKYRLHMII